MGVGGNPPKTSNTVTAASIPSNPAGTVGSPYDWKPVAGVTPSDDGTYQYKWSLQAGTTGLTLTNATSAQCEVSATALVAGTAYLDLKVTDSHGNQVSAPEKTLTFAASVQGEMAEPEKVTVKAKNK